MARNYLIMGLLFISLLPLDVQARPVARLGIQGGLFAADIIGATAGYGIHADIGFKIKQYGWIDYYPSIDFWMKTIDKDAYIKYRRMEIGLNLLEFRYFPPIPESIIARPYIGLGGIGVLAILDYERIDNKKSTDPHMHWGFDFHGGCDFILKPNLRTFVEMRGKSGGTAAFKLYAGLAYLFGAPPEASE